MNTKIQNGERLDWTNGTGSAVASGGAVIFGGRLALALVAIADTATGTIVTEGVHTLAAVNDAAFAVALREVAAFVVFAFDRFDFAVHATADHRGHQADEPPAGMQDRLHRFSVQHTFGRAVRADVHDWPAKNDGHRSPRYEPHRTQISAEGFTGA